jgi:radical SAM superfamily enzyme YgiQ (UPF0313 family)
VYWGCFGRINLMNPPLVEKMAEAGCRAIFYGIDSGSQPVLDRTAKHLRVEDVMPVLHLSAQHFDRIEASFIWGYPFETFDDFQRTVELAAEAALLAPKVSVQLHLLSPLPMSPLYRQFDGALLEPETGDSPWLLLPPLLLDPSAAELAELVRRARDIHPGFYSFPTPAKEAKLRVLEQVMHAFNTTVSSALFPRLSLVLERDDRPLGQRLMAEAASPAERIGVCMGLRYLESGRTAS